MSRLVFWMLIGMWAVAPFSNGRLVFADQDKGGSPKNETAGSLRANLYPTYGTCGSRRPAIFIAGEKMYFAVDIAGLSLTSDGEYDFSMESTLIAPTGTVIVSDSFARKELLFFGGDCYSVYFSLSLPISAPPAEYVVRNRVRDHLTNKTVENELKITLRDKKTFGMINLKLTHDFEGTTASSGVISRGEKPLLMCDIRVPKDENNEARIKAIFSVFDQQDRPVLTYEPLMLSTSNILENGVEYPAKCSFLVPEPSKYRIHVEVVNLSTNQIDQHDLPLIVNPSPVNSSSESVANKPSDINETLIDTPSLKAEELGVHACPTLVPLGSPRKCEFFAGEDMYITDTIAGLSFNAKGYTDFVVHHTLKDPNSAVVDDTEIPGKDILADSRSQVMFFGYQIPVDAKVGRYILRSSVKDNLSQKTAVEEIELTLIDGNRFDLCDLGFFYDKELEHPSGPNLAVGQMIFSRCRISLPKNAVGHEVEINEAFLDADNNKITQKETQKYSVSDFSKSLLFSGAFIPNRSGIFFVRLEAKDLSTGETVMRNLPIRVFDRLELPERKNGQEPKK